MNRLTPELWAHSALDGDTTEVLTRQLDFNLARRSGIVINRVISQMFVHVDVLSGNEDASIGIQELDVDPDNLTTEFLGAVEPDGVVLDSSRVVRHYSHSDRDTATGGGSQGVNPLLQVDWTNLPMKERPISITPLRHHFSASGAVSNIMHGEIAINYVIVELTLEELGIINASRR